jgi:beta-xylosidase
MYCTTDALGATGVFSWRTKNFNDWELMGPAFIPERDSWAIRDIWAPEVIYHNGKYYMYYTGKNEKTNRRGMSLAVAESPSGPFKEFVGRGADGKQYDHTSQVFNFGFPAIDASPFFDGDDFYLYFSKDQVDGVSSIYGVKMLDMVTPDMSTLKLLAYPTFPSIASMADSGLGSIAWEHKTQEPICGMKGRLCINITENII